MGVEKSAKIPAPAAVAQVEAETQDEIEEIMNEIQTLQQNMAEAPKMTAPAAPKLKAVPPPEPPVEEEQGIDEFRGSGDEASLEETLGAMKDEHTGPSLLDSPTESDENVQEPVAEEVPPAEEEPVSEPEAAPTAEFGTEEASAEADSGIEAEFMAETEEEPIMAVDDEIEETEAVTQAPTPIRGKRTKPVKSTGGGDGGDGCLTMTLTGNMVLKLNYEFQGQEVTVGFSEGSLHVALSDGTEFKIPVARGSAGRKAA